MSQQTLSLLAILLSAAFTYSLRLGGLLLADVLPQSGRVRAFMDALPGALLIALIAPGIAAAGVWGVVAAAATALCALKTKSPFLAMLVGMVVIALQRQLWP
jgi:uncharacterized membrane protein